VREVPGIKTVRVASGIRMDFARLDDEYLDVMARHHVGGQLEVSPESVPRWDLSATRLTALVVRG
jgi:hypothetical protein